MSSLTRRAFLAGTTGLVACKRDERVASCGDTPLSTDEREMRARLGYLETAPDPNRTCAACAQFIGGADGCGTCKLLGGNIHPLGTCKAYAPRA